MRKLKLAIVINSCLVTLFAFSQNKKFTNPLLASGADPFSTYQNGYYYYTHSTQDSLVLWKTKNLADLKNATHKTIWIPPKGTHYSKELWAPEFQFIDNKWYAYFSADDGNNDNHRMYVLENDSKDPFKGKWVFKGKLAAKTDQWAIDGDVTKFNGQLYMIWSGWEGTKNGVQEIFIAKMKNPYTIDGERFKISTPTFDWEKHGELGSGDNKFKINVNEGPQFLEHNNKLFIIFSASGCWTDYYALGMLELKDSQNVLDQNSWVKHEEPIFEQSRKNSVFATGHNSFFKSPDGTEDWILYHANSEPGQGCGETRSPRMQKIMWKKDGTPYIGLPVPDGVELDIPSESKSK